jgi:hypothetical protein
MLLSVHFVAVRDDFAGAVQEPSRAVQLEGAAPSAPLRFSAATACHAKA